MAQRIPDRRAGAAPWQRDLTAAAKNTGEMVKALSTPMLFDYMAIVMDKQALADEDFTVNVTLPDAGERLLRVKNGVLLVYKTRCPTARTYPSPARRTRSSRF